MDINQPARHKPVPGTWYTSSTDFFVLQTKRARSKRENGIGCNHRGERVGLRGNLCEGDKKEKKFHLDNLGDSGGTLRVGKKGDVLFQRE